MIPVKDWRYYSLTSCPCKVNNLSPKLADATMKLVISEFVRFPKEKTIFDPRRKITRVLREKQCFIC